MPLRNIRVSNSTPSSTSRFQPVHTNLFPRKKSQLETCDRSSHSALSPTISASKLYMIALVNHLEKYFIILLLLLVSNWDSI